MKSSVRPSRSIIDIDAAIQKVTDAVSRLALHLSDGRTNHLRYLPDAVKHLHLTAMCARELEESDDGNVQKSREVCGHHLDLFRNVITNLLRPVHGLCDQHLIDDINAFASRPVGAKYPIARLAVARLLKAQGSHKSDPAIVRLFTSTIHFGQWRNAGEDELQSLRDGELKDIQDDLGKNFRFLKEFLDCAYSASSSQSQAVTALATDDCAEISTALALLIPTYHDLQVAKTSRSVDAEDKIAARIDGWSAPVKSSIENLFFALVERKGVLHPDLEGLLDSFMDDSTNKDKFSAVDNAIEKNCDMFFDVEDDLDDDFTMPQILAILDACERLPGVITCRDSELENWESSLPDDEACDSQVEYAKNAQQTVNKYAGVVLVAAKAWGIETRYIEEAAKDYSKPVQDEVNDSIYDVAKKAREEMLLIATEQGKEHIEELGAPEDNNAGKEVESSRRLCLPILGEIDASGPVRVKDDRAALADNYRKAAQFIRVNDGCTNEAVANAVGVEVTTFNSHYKPRLKTWGFTNNKGNHAPVSWPAELDD